MPMFRTHYMKPEFFRQFSMGDKPDLAKLAETHTALRDLDAADLNAVYSEMQAPHWAQDYETTNALLESKGLAHTSMSVGDVIENLDTGELHVVSMVGFTPLMRKYEVNFDITATIEIFAASEDAAISSLNGMTISQIIDDATFDCEVDCENAVAGVVV